MDLDILLSHFMQCMSTTHHKSTRERTTHCRIRERNAERLLCIYLPSSSLLLSFCVSFLFFIRVSHHTSEEQQTRWASIHILSFPQLIFPHFLAMSSLLFLLILFCCLLISLSSLPQSQRACAVYGVADSAEQETSAATPSLLLTHIVFLLSSALFVFAVSVFLHSPLSFSLTHNWRTIGDTPAHSSAYSLQVFLFHHTQRIFTLCMCSLCVHNATLRLMKLT